MAERLCLGCMEKINDKYSECPYCGYVDGTPAKEACHIVPGTVLAGKYIVGRVVGYGGFGVTYIGYDGLLEKKIAIKEYLPSEFATRMPGQTEVTVYSGEREEQFNSGIDKFVEEGKRLAQFKEVPGIVRIFDSFTENKTAYIVMEYLEGETLKSRLEREGKLGVEDSLSIILPVLSALKEVHKIDIIHRDIAPDNIFLTSAGEVKLLDFGAARYATTTHSKSLSVIIKQGYAPEEQYRSRGEQGPWTDVYACGATLYKMLTGITPEDSMERAGKDTLRAPSKCGAKTSKNLDTAIMNAMNLRIEDRTQSAEEFEAELLSITEVKRKRVHDRKMDIGRWPLWVKLVSGVAACGILTFGVLLATGVIHFDMQKIIDSGMLASNEVYVPNLVNYSVEQAETKTIDTNLILQVVDKQNSDTIPKDKVLSQSIQDGMVVKAGTTIEVAVSAGKEIVYLEELEGLTQEEAKASLENLGLLVEIVEEESEVAPGCVIRYEAINGEEIIEFEDGIEKGSTIKLYISTGRSDIDENEDTTVPSVVGMEYTAASAIASDAKLYIYRIRGDYSASIPKGQVMEQNLSAGSKVKQGSQLGVVVSLGVQTTRVPDVQYKDKGAAASLLNSNNLTYEYQYEDSNTVAKDHVIRQSVAAGSEAAVLTKVVLYISKGNPNAGSSNVVVADNNTQNSTKNSTQNSTENSTQNSTEKNSESTATTERTSTESVETKVQVPNLYGLTEEEAKQALLDANLKAGIVNYQNNSNAKDKTVIAQGIAANKTVEAGSVVNFTVCKQDLGKVTVPNLYGLTEAEAKQALLDANLKVGTIDYQNNTSAKDKTVIAQGIAANKKVAAGSSVSFTVCNQDLGKTTVPNLVGKSRSEAEALLKEAGLSLGEAVPYSCAGKTAGTILGQSVTANSKVAKGSTVDIYYCDNSQRTITLYQGYIYSSAQSVSGYTRTSEYRWTDNWTAWQKVNAADATDKYENGTKIRWCKWELDSTALEVYNRLGNPINGDNDGWLEGTSFARPHPTNAAPITTGTQGGQVCWIQYYLIKVENKSLSNGADGIFGTETYNAVVSFQSSVGLTADGMVGPNTYNTMKSRLNAYYDAHGSWYACDRIREYKFVSTTWTTTKPTNVNATKTTTEYIYPAY